MGMHALGARARVSRRAAGRRERGARALLVVSIGLLPALAGCSSFSSSSPSSPPSSSPAAAARSGSPPDESGPSGFLVDLFRSNSTPPARTAAAPSPPSTYTPSTPTTAVPPQPSTYASSTSLGIAGPVSARSGVNIGPPPSGLPTEDTGPSGFLVDLFRSNSTPSAAPSNMPHPPSTYTASAPPYTPPPGQPAAPAPPPANSAQ